MNQVKETKRGLVLFRNLIKLCRFSKNESDANQFPVQQVEYLGKPVDVVVVMPYGSHANIPENFLGLLLQISNQEQNRVVIPTSPKERPHPIESGEVIYFHPVTGSKIHLKNNGDVDITAPNINFIGNVTISGNLTVDGDTALGANVTSNGVNISDTHVHGGVTAGGANTGAPV